MSGLPGIRALIVDDSEDDTLLIVDAISKENDEIVSRRVADAASLREALDADEWDVVISDYSMPELSAEEALRIVRAKQRHVPVIVVSGVVGEETAVELMRAGAVDYVMKDRLGRLLPAIRREMREASARSRVVIAETTARELRERLQATVARAPVGIVTADVTGRFVHVNPRFCEMLGYSADELLQLRFGDVTHPDDRERDVGSMQRMVAGELLQYGNEKRYLTRSGSVVWVDLNTAPIRDAAGQVQFFASIMLDITEKKAMERALLEREERYRAAVQTAHDDLQLLLHSTAQSIVGVDIDGRCTFINRAACDTFGYQEREVVGVLLHDILHPPMAGGSRCPHSECALDLAGAVAFSTTSELQEVLVWRRDGASLPVEFSAAPIISAGAVSGAVFIFSDVSERNLMRTQLEQANRVSSLGRLATTMAHEFNNVLMAVQPFAELLSRQHDVPEVRHTAQNIMRAVQRGRRITSGILRFATPAEPEASTIDVREWLTSTSDVLTAVLGPAVELRLHVEGESLFVHGDRHQLDQVLTNLAVNARDAMDGEGELSIVVTRGLSGHIFPFGAIPTVDKFLHMTVTDTGCGMDARTLKDIFDPFFTTKRTGTGLGLALVHQLMQLHGGSIIAESTVGHGSTFHLFIPLAQEAFPAAGARQPLVATPAVRHVLLVEDDDLVAMGVAALLRSEGIHVDIAPTAAAAFVLLEAQIPDAVILDLRLPDMDGREVYERLSSANPLLPVVFTSGSAADDLLADHLHSTHVASLTKPYEFAALMKVLGSLTLPPGSGQ